jgi:hypothetical protein
VDEDAAGAGTVEEGEAEKGESVSAQP